MLKPCFKYTSSMLQVCFNYVSSMPQVCLKYASSKLQVCFKYGSSRLQSKVPNWYQSCQVQDQMPLHVWSQSSEPCLPCYLAAVWSGLAFGNRCYPSWSWAATRLHKEQTTFGRATKYYEVPEVDNCRLPLLTSLLTERQEIDASRGRPISCNRYFVTDTDNQNIKLILIPIIFFSWISNRYWYW